MTKKNIRHGAQLSDTFGDEIKYFFAKSSHKLLAPVPPALVKLCELLYDERWGRKLIYLCVMKLFRHKLFSSPNLLNVYTN